jgi:hypothetical protein
VITSSGKEGLMGKTLSYEDGLLKTVGEEMAAPR